MTIREPRRVAAFKRMAKASHRVPYIPAILLPHVGGAKVWCVDGRAIIVPYVTRGIVVCDWVKLMRFFRRRRLAQ